ncbi:hypothetical protein IT41_08245 [Paracoccus halophilus]|uniref:Uncharacterized protein n=1 Tax=Paracoccus halophilus TaxID=376733 RepID=A0A099F3P6_9RHOB|nr:hypothetical protein IT41_08245 [Paracoccus halophilus]
MPGQIPNIAPATERAMIAEKLRLALDEIETGADDYVSIRNAVSFQREALRASHRRMDLMNGGGK